MKTIIQILKEKASTLIIIGFIIFLCSGITGSVAIKWTSEIYTEKIELLETLVPLLEFKIHHTMSRMDDCESKIIETHYQESRYINGFDEWVTRWTKREGN